jgi:hypothetical protein
MKCVEDIWKKKLILEKSLKERGTLMSIYPVVVG